MATGSPMVRRKRLGAELRGMRDRAGLTGEQVIERVGWPAVSKLSRLENGRSRPDLSDILDLLDLYEITGADREKIIAIARDAANTRGWWRSFSELGHRQRGYAQLEAGVVDIRQYQQSVIPGLLQTPDYARTRVRSELAIYGRLDAEVEVTARQARQSLLTRDDPPAYTAVIDEAALRRVAAPPEVMQAQLVHLVELAALPSVTLRVLPFAARVGEYYLPHGSFCLYRFADPDDPEMVVLETLTSDLHLGDEEDLTRYKLVFDWLAGAALTPEETVTFLARSARRP